MEAVQNRLAQSSEGAVHQSVGSKQPPSPVNCMQGGGETSSTAVRSSEQQRVRQLEAALKQQQKLAEAADLKSSQLHATLMWEYDSRMEADYQARFYRQEHIASKDRLKLVDAQLDRCTTKLHTHMVARLNASDPTHTPTAQEAELREHLDQLMCELVAAKSAHTQDVSRWGEQRSALQDRVQHLESVRDSSRAMLDKCLAKAAHTHPNLASTHTTADSSTQTDSSAADSPTQPHCPAAESSPQTDSATADSSTQTGFATAESSTQTDDSARHLGSPSSYAHTGEGRNAVDHDHAQLSNPQKELARNALLDASVREQATVWRDYDAAKRRISTLEAELHACHTRADESAAEHTAELHEAHGTMAALLERLSHLEGDACVPSHGSKAAAFEGPGAVNVVLELPEPKVVEYEMQSSDPPAPTTLKQSWRGHSCAKLKHMVKNLFSSSCLFPRADP